MVAARLPVDKLTGSPPPGWPGYGIRWVTTAIGVAVLAVVPLPPVLGALREQVQASGDEGRTGLLFPLGIVLLATALLGRLNGRAWAAVAGWVGGSIALVAALILPEPVPAIATALVIAGIVWHGWSLTWRPNRSGRRWDVAAGIGWLALAAVLAAVGRPWYVGAVVLVGLGAYIIVLAARLRGPSSPGSPVAYGAGAAAEAATETVPPEDRPPGPVPPGHSPQPMPPDARAADRTTHTAQPDSLAKGRPVKPARPGRRAGDRPAGKAAGS
jgi:hypothetical protein